MERQKKIEDLKDLLLRIPAMIQTLSKIRSIQSQKKELLKNKITELEEELLNIVKSFTSEEQKVIECQIQSELVVIQGQNSKEKLYLSEIFEKVEEWRRMRADL